MMHEYRYKGEILFKISDKITSMNNIKKYSMYTYHIKTCNL